MDVRLPGRQHFSLGLDADVLENSLGQGLVRFGIDAQRTDLHRIARDRRPVPVAVGQAAHDLTGPQRFTVVATQDGHRLDTQSAQRLSCAVAGGDELAATLVHGTGDQRGLGGHRLGVGHLAERLGHCDP